jgi:hypothetical protein
VGVHLPNHLQLADIVDTSAPASGFFGFYEGGKEHRGENADGGDNNEELDECESVGKDRGNGLGSPRTGKTRAERLTTWLVHATDGSEIAVISAEGNP